MKKFVYLFVILFMTIFSTSCKMAGLGDDVIIVGVVPNFPPLVFEKDGKIIGLEVDMLNRVGEVTGKKFIYKKYSVDGIRRALIDKKIDMVMGGITHTAKRSQYFEFTNPFFASGQMHIVRKEDVNRLGDPKKIMRMKGIKVGVERRTTGDEFVSVAFPYAKIIRFDSAQAALNALKTHKIDVVVHDAPTSWTCKDPQLAPLYKFMTKEYYAWGYRKDERKRFIPINKAIKELLDFNEFLELRRKWIPKPNEL